MKNDIDPKEKFDQFLIVMDEQIEALERDGDTRNTSLSLSMNSLESLESLFLKMTEEVDGDDLAKLIIYFSRYLGEIVIKAYGGKWKLSLGDKKNFNYDTPIVTGHSPVEKLEFSPIGVMRAFSIKKKKGMLRTAISAQVFPHPINLDDLRET